MCSLMEPNVKVVSKELSQHPEIDFWANFAEEAEMMHSRNPVKWDGFCTLASEPSSMSQKV